MTSGLFPQPASFKEKSRVYDLKSRLDWGEPALTIVDVRDRATFNQGHIMGAISIPAEDLVGRAEASLERDRDIYVYSDTDEETAAAATRLREAGFNRIAEVTGGLGAWRAAEYPVEAISTVA
ncbi:rhodanese-like domain-containing protein [Dactylococcopsis salina]|uniref:Rhodanese-related sulfurtransferase n=1 Tax=Dactylococcopsis salina (strain PCC 8305) TaxID=13035 RepID=K9YVK3_DACS8|nr:rhodanese-like domain-containing protein [Dactylococcopsis salina]AFZ50956.1 Rhodanese-related sulfurtransferase [Dactylococcopsis salina PCC 8305]